MADLDLSRLNIDQLTELVGKAQSEMASREKQRRKDLRSELERRLEAEGYNLNDIFPELGTGAVGGRQRRKMPVKFRNPQNPDETWTGIGRSPRWVQAILDERGIDMGGVQGNSDVPSSSVAYRADGTAGRRGPVTRRGTPRESQSQSIGEDAKRMFHAFRPSSWRPDDLSGDADVGYDFHLQVVQDEEYQYTFRLQVKGTRTPKYVRSRNSFRISFDSTTLRYYANTADPVLFIFVDLSRGADPESASAYYVWLDAQVDQICERMRTASSPYKTCSVYVPLENRFDRNFDVSEYMNRHIRENRSARGFMDAIVTASPSRITEGASASLDTLSTRLRLDGSSFLEPLLNESSFPWPDVPEGSFAGSLYSAHRALELSDAIGAAQILASTPLTSHSVTSHENAEYQYLIGRTHVFQNRTQVARDCFKKAIRLYPAEPKYTTAWVDELLRGFFADSRPQRFARLFRVLPDSSRNEVLGLKAKLLSMLDRHEEALAFVSQLPLQRQHLSYALVYSLACNWSDTRTACATGLADPNLPTRHQTLLYILRARATFNLLLEHATGKPASSVPHIPLTGPAGLDTEVLKDCWSDCVEALSRLRRNGWPLEVEPLADFLAIPAIALNQQETILASVQEAASVRPHILALQSCLEYLAFSCGNLKLALEATRRQPSDPAQVTRQALLSFEIHENRACLEIVLEELNRTRASGVSIDPDLLAVGAVAAHFLLDNAHENQLLQLLREGDVSVPQFAVYNYLVRCADAPLECENALSELANVYDEYPSHTMIKGILFQKLDTHSSQSAQRLVAIYEATRGTREFALDETLRIAESLATLSRWSDLLLLAEKEMARFGSLDNLVTIKAFALESIGESGKALDLLQALVKKDQGSTFTLTYVHQHCCSLRVYP